MKNENIKKITLIGILSALAIIIAFLMRIPIFPSAPFLSYDAKDVIIAIGGFILGPVPALIMTLIASFIEAVTFSSTGFIGFIMNFLSTASFACIASIIYKKKHSLSGAIYGLILGVSLMTCIMLLWNYIITPAYMGYPRKAVADMLLPVFLPFNLIKGTINASLTMLLYKPISTALKRSGFIKNNENAPSHFKISVLLVSLFVFASCIVCVILIRNG